LRVPTTPTTDEQELPPVTPETSPEQESVPTQNMPVTRSMARAQAATNLKFTVNNCAKLVQFF